MASFQTAFTPKSRRKFALVKTRTTPNVGPAPQILVDLENYHNSQRIEAKHDLRKYMNQKAYRLVKLRNNQQLTRLPVTF